jgi:hypothetical protein
MYRKTSAMTATLLLAGAALVAGASTAQAARASGGVTIQAESLRGPFPTEAVCDQHRTALLNKTDGAAGPCTFGQFPPPLGIGPGWYFEFFNNPDQ